MSEAIRQLRACYLRKRLFVVVDNRDNVHDHPRFLALLRRLHIHPMPTPTGASWLNAIEAHFGVTKRATLTGSDDYLRYRNRRVGHEDHSLTRIRSIRPIKLDGH